MVAKGHVGFALSVGLIAVALASPDLVAFQEIVTDWRLLLLYLLSLVVGSIAPDLDYFFVGRTRRYDRVLEAHRQVTHGIAFAAMFLGALYLFALDVGVAGRTAVIGFIVGYLTHIFSDIFFGKYGVPLFFYSRYKKERVSFSLFRNGGRLDRKTIPSVAPILLGAQALYLGSGLVVALGVSVGASLLLGRIESYKDVWLPAAALLGLSATFVAA
jgi:membrane-bound metal-dependent hydrolase YbcI (DUF457 family)